MFFRKKKEPISWIVVFLGNPGVKFADTRHNAGFMTADAIADKYDTKINKAKFSALTAVVSYGNDKVMLMKPQTYMNLSGDAVRQAIKYYKLPQKNIIVVSDDITLPPGKQRIRREGSAGGHNGLKDIIKKSGGDDFPRIRIGVGSPPDGCELMDWVLSKPGGDDMQLIKKSVQNAALAVEMIIKGDIDKAMQLFN